ncbi:hypothetical protein, partial [Actinomadura sp. CNU-125]|uniref:hypothetical protein n=1 Tax=Actinomadura sp. CNU-125 TaxID=1904961 RepID=UPI0016522A55
AGRGGAARGGRRRTLGAAAAARPARRGRGLALAASLRGAARAPRCSACRCASRRCWRGSRPALSLQAASLARIRPETDAQRLAGLVQGQYAWLCIAAAAGLVAAVPAVRAARNGRDARPAAGRRSAANASGTSAAR